MPEEKKNRDVRDATFGHTKSPDVQREQHSNRVAAHDRVERTQSREEPEAVELPSAGITTDPKVEALIKSGKPLEVGGDNILREVKPDTTSR